MTNTVETPLDVVSGILREILDEYVVEDIEITPQSLFFDDLELESIDLVALAGRLQEHYGEQINLAEFLANREIEDVIALTVGQLVDYVASCL